MSKPFRTASSMMMLSSWFVVLLLGVGLFAPTTWSQQVNVSTESIPTTTLLPTTTLAPLTSTQAASSSLAPLSTTVTASTVASSTVPASTVSSSTQAASPASTPASTTQVAPSSSASVSTAASSQVASTTSAPVSTTQAASLASVSTTVAASTQAGSTVNASTTSATVSTSASPPRTTISSTAASVTTTTVRPPSSSPTSSTIASSSTEASGNTSSTSTIEPSIPPTQTTSSAPSIPSQSSTSNSQTVSTTPPTVASSSPTPLVPSTVEIVNQNEKSNETSSSSSIIISTIPPSKIIISDPDFNITANVTKPRLYDQMTDFMPENIRNSGGVIVHIILLAYVCLALGIVCDIYFLSSLEFISNGLRLPSDIAGATFMAIGTSAPELFTSLIGVFISEDDIGTGTILGSAVFNIIFIPAVCGFAVWLWCDTVPKVSKFSLLRDIIFYLITITTLLLALKDNEIDWIESVAMLGLFVIYLVIMYFNAQVGELLSANDTSSTTESTESTPLLNSQNAILMKGGKAEEWEIEKGQYPEKRPRYGSVTEEGDVDEDNWVESSMSMKILMFPAMIAFKLTLPKPTKYCFFLTFVISIVWISVLTYGAVWLVTIIGYTFSIPDTISGLTILAAGTSIPELISSVLVVKRAGLANMALCNTIGSNIFDILIGLGLPWFIKSMLNIINLGSLDPNLTMVPVQSAGLPFTTFTLLVTVVALVATLSSFKWRLGLGVGITCTLVYIAFLVISCIFELWLN